jgi:hypothetical protein
MLIEGTVQHVIAVFCRLSVYNVVYLFLQVLVYVSTAFSNCERKIIEERIYPTPVDASRLLATAQWLDPAAMDAIFPW